MEIPSKIIFIENNKILKSIEKEEKINITFSLTILRYRVN